MNQIFVGPKFFSEPKSFSDSKSFFGLIFFRPKLNFNENDVWREKTDLLNLKLSKLARAKGLLKLEFDTKDQVLLSCSVIVDFGGVLLVLLLVTGVKQSQLLV